MFDPNQNRPTEQQKDFGGNPNDDNIPTGAYALTVTNVMYRWSSKKSKQYIKARFTVIAGKFEGASFWGFLPWDYINDDRHQNELNYICDAANIRTRFDPTEPKSFGEVLNARAFMCKINRRTRGGKSENRIGYWIPRSEVESAQLNWITKWEAQHQSDEMLQILDKRTEDAEQQDRGGYGGNDYGGGGGATTPQQRAAARQEFGDDDIPF